MASAASATAAAAALAARTARNTLEHVTTTTATTAATTIAATTLADAPAGADTATDALLQIQQHHSAELACLLLQAEQKYTSNTVYAHTVYVLSIDGHHHLSMLMTLA